MLKPIDGLVVVGVDAASIAKSAFKLGYNTYVVDYFGDVDVSYFCTEREALVKQKEGVSCGKFIERFRPDVLLENMRSLIQKKNVDYTLLSSGLDDSFSTLQQINELTPILGNSPEVVRDVRDSSKFISGLRSISVSFPRTAIVSNPEEIEDAAEKIGYPVVIKPERGFGGFGVQSAWDSETLNQVFLKEVATGQKVVIQELVEGAHASMSIMVANGHVQVLTINEQLLGLSSAFQLEPFGYCGNLVPTSLSDSALRECKLLAKRIARYFNLVGSNGIDLVISDEGIPKVIEVNPRFQGSIECVERVLAISLVKSHITACLEGTLPDIQPTRTRYCTRLILYAPERIVVPDLTHFRWVRNVPLPGSVIERGEPFCSVLADGENGGSSLNEAHRRAHLVYQNLRSVDVR